MKLKDKIIEDAIEALRGSDIIKNGEYDSEYKGYISSFGASIIQSGLLPAVIFYENSSRSKSEKVKLIHAIVKVLKSQSGLYAELEFDESKKLNKAFSAFIIKHQAEKKQIEKDVDEAAVALKLAIRTFKEKKSKSGNNDEQ